MCDDDDMDMDLNADNDLDLDPDDHDQDILWHTPGIQSQSNSNVLAITQGQQMHRQHQKTMATTSSTDHNPYSASLDDTDKSQLVHHFNDDNNNNGINSNNNHSRISSSQNISRYVLRTFGGMFDNSFIDEDNEPSASYYRAKWPDAEAAMPRKFIHLSLAC